MKKSTKWTNLVARVTRRKTEKTEITKVKNEKRSMSPDLIGSMSRFYE